MSLKQLTALFALGALWGASYIFIRVAVAPIGPVMLMFIRAALDRGDPAGLCARPPDTAEYPRALAQVLGLGVLWLGAAIHADRLGGVDRDRLDGGHSDVDHAALHRLCGGGRLGRAA